MSSHQFENIKNSRKSHGQHLPYFTKLDQFEIDTSRSFMIKKKETERIVLI